MNNITKYICLKDAAKISGYHQDYLGHLIRTGKLHGQKVGRSWMTTKADLTDFIENRSVSTTTKFFLSRIGLAIITSLVLVFIISATFIASLEFQNSTANVFNSHVEEQLNLSSVDNLPVIER